MNGGIKTYDVRDMNETAEHFMLECERYESAGSRMSEEVAEDIGVKEWSEMRNRNSSRQIKY